MSSEIPTFNALAIFFLKGTTVTTFLITTTLTNRLTKKRGYKGVAEWFGVYSPDTGKVYMVSVNERGNGGMKLRLHPTRNNQEKNVRWAKDYEI